MGFTIENSVSAVTVFLQGALSFFSPCVLPLVPLYVGYLAGGAATVGEDGVRRYPRGKVFLNTLFFVAGISFAFFLLGLGLSALGTFSSRIRCGLPGPAGSSSCSSASTSWDWASGPPCWNGSAACPSGWTGWP